MQQTPTVRIYQRTVKEATIKSRPGSVGQIPTESEPDPAGGIPGYYGGAVDSVIQRTIKFLRAIPTYASHGREP